MRTLASLRLTAAALVLGALLVTPLAGANGGDPSPSPVLNPIIFVHGSGGSGAQFESQKMRYEVNGYPESLVTVLEYDSTFSLNTMAAVHAKLDALIAALKLQTGRPQVDILGHSLGTTVMHAYLATPARAANVAHYVNIDGRTSTSPPGGVPTLAIWAGVGTPGRQIGGATNVTLPNQTHVEAATSEQSFAAAYEFFTGDEPATTEVKRSNLGGVHVSGRAVIFPQNVGVTGATLEVWKVGAGSGKRLAKRPEATPALAADGSWGPVRLRRGAHYEFAVVRAGVRTHHFYYEPFLRDDHLVRLLTSLPGVGNDAPTVPKSDAASQLTILRYKELWGDQGDGSDVLEIDGVNVCTSVICPRSKLVNGVQVVDWGSDGVTNLARRSRCSSRWPSGPARTSSCPRQRRRRARSRSR